MNLSFLPTVSPLVWAAVAALALAYAWLGSELNSRLIAGAFGTLLAVMILLRDFPVYLANAFTPHGEALGLVLVFLFCGFMSVPWLAYAAWRASEHKSTMDLTYKFGAAAAVAVVVTRYLWEMSFVGLAQRGGAFLAFQEVLRPFVLGY